MTSCNMKKKTPPSPAQPGPARAHPPPSRLPPPVNSPASCRVKCAKLNQLNAQLDYCRHMQNELAEVHILGGTKKLDGSLLLKELDLKINTVHINSLS